MTTHSVSQRLHDQLGHIIAITSPGARLPSEPELAKMLGVSRATLREAMRTFETQGMIQRRQGSGTYVNRPPKVLESGLEVLESIETIANRSSLSVSTGELNLEQRPASPDECQLMGLSEGEELLNVSRVIMAETRPVAYLVDMLPLQIITPEELENQFSGSILDLLLKRGNPRPLTSRTEINAVTASPQVARALGIQRGDVLLCFAADLYDTSGRIIDHSISYFLPGYFRFHVIRKVG